MYHCSQAQTKGQRTDAGGAILQETPLSHICHLNSRELFSQHLKQPSLCIIHDLETNIFTSFPPQCLHFMGQVRGRLSLGGISKSGTRQSEKRGASELCREEQGCYIHAQPYLCYTGSSLKTDCSSTRSRFLARVICLGLKSSLLKTQRQLPQKYHQRVGQ